MSRPVWSASGGWLRISSLLQKRRTQRGCQAVPPHLRERIDAKQRHVAVDLVLKQFDTRDARRPRRRSRPRRGTAARGRRTARPARAPSIRRCRAARRCPSSRSSRLPGRRSRAARAAATTAPSSCRPPWFETMMPSTPLSRAMRASSRRGCPSPRDAPSTGAGSARDASRRACRAGRVALAWVREMRGTRRRMFSKCGMPWSHSVRSSMPKSQRGCVMPSQARRGWDAAACESRCAHCSRGWRHLHIDRENQRAVARAVTRSTSCVMGPSSPGR